MKTISAYLKRIPVWTFVVGAMFVSSQNGAKPEHLVPALLFLVLTSVLDVTLLLNRQSVEAQQGKQAPIKRRAAAFFALSAIIFFELNNLFVNKLVGTASSQNFLYHYDALWSTFALFLFGFLIFPIILKSFASEKAQNGGNDRC